MKENGQDRLARAYAMLQALRNNITELASVREIYVREYHTALDMLESIGIDINDFRIPNSEVKPRIRSISNRGPTYSEEKYVPKQLLLAKLDAILIYFNITLSEKPKKIGFSPHDKL